MTCRPGLLAVSTLALLAFGDASQAQTTTSATPAQLEQALADSGIPFTRGKDGYEFKLNDRLTTLQLFPNGSRLLVKTVLTGRKASLETLNRYNEEKAVTTRAVRYAQAGTVLEAGYDCQLGVSAEAVAKFLAGFRRDLREFDGFLVKAQQTAPEGAAEAGGPGEPPAPGKQPVYAKPAGVPIKLTKGTAGKEVIVEFPTREGAPRETAWKIIWDMKTGKEAAKEGFQVSGRSGSPVLFQIKQAYYRPGPTAQWLQVLENAHPSEFYVPYFFQHTRFFDLRDVGSYTRLNVREGGARSRLLGKEGRVMAELRDRGLAYKHGNRSRRGEELVLWANFVAGNYTYLVEFCFHDDGTIAFKHAPTGYNFFDHFDSAAHMHNCLWRIGVKLGPADASTTHNDVAVVKLPYDPKGLGPNGKLDLVPLPSEGFCDFEAKEFTRLRVTNPNYTVFPRSDKRPQLPISYDLVPLTQGIARHLANKDEAFSHHDFWVTRSDCPEKMYVNLPGYFQKGKTRPLAGSDGVVLWHISSALHVPRGEDGIYGGNNLDNGQALVSFTNVELRPRNLFIRTPLYEGANRRVRD